jgi:hypothetical protein
MTTHPILNEMDSVSIRILIARAAGLLAHRDGVEKTHEMLMRVASRLVRAQ